MFYTWSHPNAITKTVIWLFWLSGQHLWLKILTESTFFTRACGARWMKLSQGWFMSIMTFFMMAMVLWVRLPKPVMVFWCQGFWSHCDLMIFTMIMIMICLIGSWSWLNHIHHGHHDYHYGQAYHDDQHCHQNLIIKVELRPRVSCGCSQWSWKDV